jgi:hypothetical protein
LTLAVDGYKNLKFGMTIQQILGSNICTLQENDSGQVGVEYYWCGDFRFGGESIEAGAFFIEGKFLRFVVVLSTNVVVGLSKGLADKYGQPSSSSTPQEFQAIDTQPNREAFMAFDNNTVYLKLMSDENYIQSAILLYTSPSYERLLLKNQKESVSNDL